MLDTLYFGGIVHWGLHHSCDVINVYWLLLPIHVVLYHSLRLAPRCPASTLLSWIVIFHMCVYICFAQSGKLRSLEIVLRILGIPRLRRQSRDCITCVRNLEIACACTPNSKITGWKTSLISGVCLQMEAYCDPEGWVMLCVDEQWKRSRSRSKFACRS